MHLIGHFMGNFLRASLTVMLFIAVPAFAQSSFDKETLEEMASVRAYISECNDRELLSELRTNELYSIIVDIVHSPLVNTKWFISESQTRIAEIEGLSDGDMVTYCATLNNYLIRWSMKYWTLFQEHQQ